MATKDGITKTSYGFGTIPFNLILANDEDNARQTVDGIEELAADIGENGLLEPVGVQLEEDPELTEDEKALLGLDADDPAPARVGRLVYGFRRYYAIQMLRSEDESILPDVPFREVVGNKLDAIYANLDENIARKQLTPGEMADRFFHLHFKLGQAVDTIAKKVPTLSKGYIQSLIALRKKLIAPAWESFKGGDLTFDVAKQIAAAKGEKAQTELLEEAQGASVGQEGKAKKVGVKAKVAAAAKRQKGESNATSRPSLKLLKQEMLRYEDPQTNYDTAVRMTLEWVTGQRKTIPRPKNSPPLKELPTRGKKKGAKKAAGKKASSKPSGAKPNGAKPAAKPSSKPAAAKPASKKPSKPVSKGA